MSFSRERLIYSVHVKHDNWIGSSMLDVSEVHLKMYLPFYVEFEKVLSKHANADVTRKGNVLTMKVRNQFFYMQNGPLPDFPL